MFALCSLLSGSILLSTSNIRLPGGEGSSRIGTHCFAVLISGIFIKVGAGLSMSLSTLLSPGRIVRALGRSCKDGCTTETEFPSGR